MRLGSRLKRLLSLTELVSGVPACDHSVQLRFQSLLWCECDSNVGRLLVFLGQPNVFAALLSGRVCLNLGVPRCTFASFQQRTPRKSEIANIPSSIRCCALLPSGIALAYHSWFWESSR